MTIPNRNTEVAIFMNNEKIEEVNNYNYLGVNINNKLDFKQMANYRLRNGYQTFEVIKKSLAAKTIPLIFKKLLIKSVLIPRASYGIDLFGYRYSNLTGLKRLINKAIRLAVNDNQVCISAALNELNIDPIEETGRYMAMKNIDQKEDSKSIVKQLFKNEKYIKPKKGVKRTRMLELKEFSKKNKIPITNKRTMKKKIHELFKIKPRFNPDNKTNQMRSKYK